jgi:hypothetical protein
MKENVTSKDAKKLLKEKLELIIVFVEIPDKYLNANLTIDADKK